MAYDLEAAAKTLTKESLASRVATLWRYEEVLPVVHKSNQLSLGEGWTPLHKAEKLGAKYGFPNLYIKDEGVNPTQSFKARGMALAVSMAKELGVTKVAAPSAGNAAGALSAYAALAGMECHIFVPQDTPKAFIVECEVLGARLIWLTGLFMIAAE